MTYRYISDAMDDTRRLLRMLPGNVRKTEYRRKALSPGAHGQHRWGFPTTWLMDHHTGYWQSIAIPKMDEQISKSAWGAVLHQPTKSIRVAGETAPAESTNLKSNLSNGENPPYQAGMPLRPDEIQRAQPPPKVTRRR